MTWHQLPRRSKLTEFTTFVAIVSAAAILVISLVSWFDSMDAFDKKAQECLAEGKQMVKVLGQVSYTCVRISPR